MQPSLSYYNSRERKLLRKVFPTYRDLRRNLQECLKNSARIDTAGFLYDVHEVHVMRSRRGQWGEWFETWQSDPTGKPILIKEGWM